MKLFIILVAAAAAILMYWSHHLTSKAMGAEDAAAKISLLKKAVFFWGLNDSARYELGKAYFDYGYQNLNTCFSSWYLTRQMTPYFPGVLKAKLAARMPL